MALTPRSRFKYQQALAQQMGQDAASTAPVQHWTQGLARMLQGGLSGYLMNKGMQGEAELDEARRRTMAQALGAGSPDAALGILAQNPETADMGAQLGFQRMFKETDAVKPTSAMQEYEIAKAQGFEGTFLDYQKALAEARRPQTNVTLTQGGPAPPRYIPGADAGLPAGWRYDTLLDKAEPIPGGPAAVEQETLAEKGEQRQEAREIQGGIVMDDINRSIAAIQENPRLVTGAGGAFTSVIPGTPAHDLSQTISTIQANTAFDTLQGMREASPTGGALGGVSAPELAFLRDAKGALAQTQSADQLIYNLTRLGDAYMDAVHGTPQEIMRLASEGKISFEVATQLSRRSPQYRARSSVIPGAGGAPAAGAAPAPGPAITSPPPATAPGVVPPPPPGFQVVR